MRSYVTLGLVSICSLVLLSGCGGVPAFQSNDLAVQTFGNSTWGDASGTVKLTFDSSAKIVGLTVPGLPPEIGSNFNVLGEPFDVTVPADLLPPEFSQYAGTYKATLQNTKMVVNSDGSLDVQFTGNANIPLLQSITLNVTGNFNGQTLSNLTGSLVAKFPIVGDIPLGDSMSLAEGIPVVKQ